MDESRRVCYPCDKCGAATFVPRCEKCGRYVKANKSVFVNEITELKDTPNAICKKYGRTKMLFEGFF